MSSLDYAQEARVLAIAERAGTSNTLTVDEADIPLVKVAITKAEADIRKSRAKIPNPPYLGAQIAHLKRLQVAIAPHKKLPYELWRKVLISFVDSSNPSFYTPSDRFLGTTLYKEYIPWTFRQVSSPWRQLVLNHLPFWNRLVVEPPILSKFEDNGRSRSPIAEEQAESERTAEEARNRALVQRWEQVVQRTERLIAPEGKLSIGILGKDTGIDGWRPSLGDTRRDFSSLLSTHLGVEFLQRHGPRIASLNVCGCGENELERLWTVDPTVFSSLERLSLDYDRCGNRFILQNTSIFRASTHLRYLTIHSDSNAVEALLPANIPWSQLSQLGISQRAREHPMIRSQIYPSPVLHVLGQARNLTNLTLKLDIEAQNAILPHVTLPLLEKFHLTTKYMGLLDHLTLPSLRTLDLVRSHKDEDILEVVRAVINLLQRSGCTLEVFREAPGNIKFRGVPYDQHRPEFEELVCVRLRNVKEVDTAGIIFGVPELERIANYEVFPSATSIGFRCSVPSPQVLLIMQPRLSDQDLRKRLERLRAQSEQGTWSNKQAKEAQEDYRKKFNNEVNMSYETGREWSLERLYAPDISSSD